MKGAGRGTANNQTAQFNPCEPLSVQWYLECDQGTPPSGIRLRAFPLGLLAPSFLGAPHLPHQSRLRSRWCGRRARLGGGKAPPPSVSSPRASALRRTQQSWAGLGQPSPPTPYLVFLLRSAVSLPLLNFVSSVRVGAHPWSTAALAEMPEGKHPTSSNHCTCACPSLPCAHTPPTKGRQGLWAGLPRA